MERNEETGNRTSQELFQSWSQGVEDSCIGSRQDFWDAFPLRGEDGRDSRLETGLFRAEEFMLRYECVRRLSIYTSQAGPFVFIVHHIGVLALGSTDKVTSNYYQLSMCP
jgi:hypothetical protein